MIDRPLVVPRLRRVAALAAVAGPLVVLVGLAGPVGAQAATTLPSGCAQSGLTVTCTYTSVGESVFVVPAGIATVSVDAVGAAGGAGAPGDPSGGFTGAAGVGGAGASVSASSVSVIGDPSLYVEVGGSGTAGVGCDTSTGAAGGSGGGGTGGTTNCNHGNGGGGGGASGVQTQSAMTATLSAGADDPRLVVAGGGGGGGGGAGSAGAAGGAAGGGNPGAGAGGVANCQGDGAAGGVGGVGAGGGAGGQLNNFGSDCPYASNGATGTAGSGGAAGSGGGFGPDAEVTGPGPGGGGGGFTGGGGGATTNPDDSGSGGGGGSSFGPTGSTTYATAGTDTPASVTISYALPVAPVCTGNTASTAENTAVSVTFNCTGTGLTYSVASGPSDGTLGPISGGMVIYTPKSGFSGKDSFTVTATDIADQTTTDTVTLTVTPPATTSGPADVAVAIHGPGSARDGSSFTETIQTSNHGPGTATNVITGVIIPKGLTATNTNGGARYGSAVYWTAPSLTSGQSDTYTLTLTVANSAHGNVIIPAAAASTKVKDPNYANNVAATTVTLGPAPSGWHGNVLRSRPHGRDPLRIGARIIPRLEHHTLAPGHEHHRS